jgi:hypothetical protein
MKLDYLPDGSPDCPLIRLYAFMPAEAKQLLAVAQSLANGDEQRIDVHRLPFVEAANGYKLTFVTQSWDGAVVRRDEPSEFECGLTRSTWENVAALIEPFKEGATGFQWLADEPGEAALLLSQSGQW